tara:strand:+ start:5640 stop:6071 length:432 start_codon:yes stop_codon:yes gene_type:complete
MLSLYIPVIQEHITENYIKSQFKNHNIGKVMRVDFVKNLNKNGRREAFIHFDEWFDNETSRTLQEDIKNPDTKTRFVYQDKKFFPLLVNKNAHRRVNNPSYEVLNIDDPKTSLKLIVSIPIEHSVNDETKRRRMTYAEATTVD